MYDVIIRNGRLMDGTGGPWHRADLAIAGDKIVAIQRQIDGETRREIDAEGLIVAPGFIDMHAHSDVTLLVNPRAESAVRQGITTQLVGQCGFSAAPVRPEDLADFRSDSFIFSFEGYDWSWNDMAGYRQTLKNAGPAINVATLVGHGALRQYAMGQENRPPTEDEMAVMKSELDRALEQGAIGLSSGLTYAPGRFCEADELVELGKVVARHGGAYHTHMRDYTRFLLDSIEESIRVGEEAGIPVNTSHTYPAGKEFWGELAHKATDLVDAARSRSVEVTFDITPWTRGGGPFMQLLPSWAQEGGVAGMKARLADTATRARISQDMAESNRWKGRLEIPWDDQIVARVGKKAHHAWVGRTIAEISAERGLPPAEGALIMLLEDDGQFWTAPTTKSQDDINHILSHSLGVPITDGMALAPYGPLGEPTNPRSYGTFPRILGRYAREWGVISMEVAVQKLTSMPAQRMGLSDRGILRPGLYADITIFDPGTVIDRETYQDSHAFPAGIEFVFVNGQLVVERNLQHDIRPGVIL